MNNAFQMITIIILTNRIRENNYYQTENSNCVPHFLLNKVKPLMKNCDRSVHNKYSCKCSMIYCSRFLIHHYKLFIFHISASLSQELQKYLKFMIYIKKLEFPKSFNIKMIMIILMWKVAGHSFKYYE